MLSGGTQGQKWHLDYEGCKKSKQLLNQFSGFYVCLFVWGEGCFNDMRLLLSVQLHFFPSLSLHSYFSCCMNLANQALPNIGSLRKWQTKLEFFNPITKCWREKIWFGQEQWWWQWRRRWRWRWQCWWMFVLLALLWETPCDKLCHAFFIESSPRLYNPIL